MMMLASARLSLVVDYSDAEISANLARRTVSIHAQTSSSRRRVRVTNNESDSSPEMTSHGGGGDERKAVTVRQYGDRRATAVDVAAAGVDGPLQDREAVTDRVIRQLIDQIAQLQRASDARAFIRERSHPSSHLVRPHFVRTEWHCRARGGRATQSPCMLRPDHNEVGGAVLSNLSQPRPTVASRRTHGRSVRRN